MSTEFGMPHEQALLNRICANCGEDYGKHRARRNSCPIVEDKRSVAYHEEKTFVEWEDDSK